MEQLSFLPDFGRKEKKKVSPERKFVEDYVRMYVEDGIVQGLKIPKEDAVGILTEKLLNNKGLWNNIFDLFEEELEFYVKELKKIAI